MIESGRMGEIKSYLGQHHVHVHVGRVGLDNGRRFTGFSMLFDDLLLLQPTTSGSRAAGLFNRSIDLLQQTLQRRYRRQILRCLAPIILPNARRNVRFEHRSASTDLLDKRLACSSIIQHFTGDTSNLLNPAKF